MQRSSESHQRGKSRGGGTRRAVTDGGSAPKPQAPPGRAERFGDSGGRAFDAAAKGEG
jgi:hypothetical protein